MRFLLSLWLATCVIAHAESAGAATDMPDVLARMLQGLEASKIEELTSKVYRHKYGEYSYHLKTMDYLGTVHRDGRRYTVAAARYLRSSAKGSEYPPARGHGFLIVFDDAFRVATHGRMDFGEYAMHGHVLKSGDEIIVDFGSKDPAIRYHGWMLDSAFLPYPFADRISEKEWESGAFRNR